MFPGGPGIAGIILNKIPGLTLWYTDRGQYLTACQGLDDLDDVGGLDDLYDLYVDYFDDLFEDGSGDKLGDISVDDYGDLDDLSVSCEGVPC